MDKDILPKVLLAPNEQISFDDPRIKYPMLASRKYDGNRNVLLDGEFRSRSMKLQANRLLPKHLKELVEYSKVNRIVFDGELWSPKLTFTQLQEIVRAFNVFIPEHVGFYIFDMLPLDSWGKGTENVYWNRYQDCMNLLAEKKFPKVFGVQHYMMPNAEKAQEAFQVFLDEGYEGVILRGPYAGYKHNRATHKEGIIYKFKNFVTDDAIIVDAIEMQKMKEKIRDGDRERDEQGHLKRTHKQNDFEPADTLGSLVVKMKDGTCVGIGLGRRDAEERKRLWEEHKKKLLLGKWVEFSWMPHGTKDKPRIGKLLRFRPDLDT